MTTCEADQKAVSVGIVISEPHAQEVVWNFQTANPMLQRRTDRIT
jgi:hypothetical protein